MVRLPSKCLAGRCTIKDDMRHLLAISLFFCLSCLDTRDPPDVRVKVLYPMGGGKGDRSFADSVFTGVMNARLQFDFFVDEAEPKALPEAEKVFSDWIAQPAVERELIVVVGENYRDMVAERTCDYGGRFVLHLDVRQPPCAFLRSISYRTFTPSFLAGVAAMELSTTKKAAAIGGMDLDTVNEFIRGFQQGVEHAGGQMTAIQYIGDTPKAFDSPDTAKTMALKLFGEVDAILPVAGGSSLGIIDAAKEAPEGQRWYAFGVDEDMSYRGIDVVVGSIIKRLDRTVTRVLLDTANGEFKPGDHVARMEQGGTEFFVNPTFIDRVQQVVDQSRQAAFAADADDYDLANSQNASEVP
jgi:basic membrane protein A